MARPGQEKLIICTDTFSPELNCWLEGVAEEIICLRRRQSQERDVLALKLRGAHEKVPT